MNQPLSSDSAFVQTCWQAGRFRLDLQQPQIMGIVNVTPDSFSDGGQHADVRSALVHAEQLIRQGANILDIGGESSRPGAAAVPLEEELHRVLPVVQEAVRFKVPISVDTYKPEVMQAVLDVGADIINDIYALRWRSGPQGLSGEQVVAQHGQCGICLMHMHRDPQSMQIQPMPGSNEEVVQAVAVFLQTRTDVLVQQGVARDRIVWDPGIGFGKTVPQNLALLAWQARLQQTGQAVLAGWSRKSTLGAVLEALPPGITDVMHRSDLLPHDRSLASVAAALLAVEKGVRIVRVHDVAATRQALAVWRAMQAQDARAA
ncbi:MAG: dihydropteroate synthase [Brachymonas sp.]|nr:dihydropteroate synthase [Brachymonas sp.]